MAGQVISGCSHTVGPFFPFFLSGDSLLLQLKLVIHLCCFSSLPLPVVDVLFTSNKNEQRQGERLELRKTNGSLFLQFPQKISSEGKVLTVHVLYVLYFV